MNAASFLISPIPLKDLRGFLNQMGLGSRVLLTRQDFEACSLTMDQHELLTEWVDRYIAGEPFSKIVGVREFWKNSFYVNRHVLDPRPESETLVEAVLKTYLDKDVPLRFLDLGIGSGCLLLSLLAEYQESFGIGVDLSEEALHVASHNAISLNVSNRCSFVRSSWISSLHGFFDIIISNPPYIGHDEPLSSDVLIYDPHQALFASDNGLECYKAILSQIHYIKFNHLFFEVGYRQSKQIQDLATQHDLTVEKIYKDKLEHNRVVKITNK